MKCQKCGQREGTENWVGDGGVLAFTHGLVAQWCKLCVVEAQIAHAEKLQQQLPDLYQRRAELVKSS